MLTSLRLAIGMGLAFAGLALPVPVAGAAQAGGDFDGDGIDDLAIGAPFEDLTFELETDAGVVHVIYGAARGLRADVSQVLDDDLVGGETEAADLFGQAVAAGDFNGDGIDDLAIGVPGETINPGGGDRFNAGAIRIVPGSRHGLQPARAYGFSQIDFGLTVEADDYFGLHLVSGDFGRGGDDDLAIGTPNEDIEADAASRAGIVNVLYGTDDGLTATGALTVNQGDLGGSPGTNEDLGFSLAAGDTGGGRVDELVIGVPGQSLGPDGDPIPAAGVVHVLHGRNGGFDPGDSRMISRATPKIAGAPGAGDRFGYSLALADLGRDGRADLAVGAATDQQGTDERRGSVNIIYGAKGGLIAKGSRVISQATKGVAGAPADGDFFGSALAAGDLGGDSRAELVVGIPGEQTPTAGNPAARGGAVQVFIGGKGGLAIRGNRLITQDSPGVGDTVEGGERVGDVLAIGQFGRSAEFDLVIGVPAEGIGGITGAGIVHVLYGAAAGLATRGSQIWTQANSGGGESAEANDAFGTGLAG